MQLELPSVPLPLIINVIVTPGLNPVPDTTAETPVGPWLGVSVIVGVVIVNDCCAVSLVTVPTSEPAIVTVYGVPDAVPAIVTEQLNAPVALTVAEHVEIVAPAPIDAVSVTPGL